MPERFTIKSFINEATQQLMNHDVDSPELNARILLAHILRIDEWQLAVYRQEISKKQTKQYEDLIRKRCQRIPLQHLVGSVGFYGLNVEVSSNALIPRPETELLVETVIKTIHTHQRESQPITLLDMATGTGCIALALAKELPEAKIWGIDVSEKALVLAKRNAGQTGLDKRVHWIQSDLWKSVENPNQKWDYIISNPPYIPTNEINELEPEVRDHDPKLALDGGKDGLDFYRSLSIQASQWIASDGYLFLECGKDQAEDIEILFKNASWFADQVVRDYNNIQRILVFRRANTPKA